MDFFDKVQDELLELRSNEDLQIFVQSSLVYCECLTLFWSLKFQQVTIS